MSRPVALILGAAVHADGPSPSLRRRTLHAAQLWHAGRVGHLIPCGGLGRHPPAEAQAMRDLLLAAGVPDSAITPEPASTTTRENIALALPILARLGAREVVIVTDRWHAPRARLIARRLGLHARADAPPLAGTRPLVQARMALREVAAYAADWWRFRP